MTRIIKLITVSWNIGTAPKRRGLQYPILARFPAPEPFTPSIIDLDIFQLLLFFCLFIPACP